jgi:hypothetical protein
MKAARIVILFPLISVIIVSLYVRGGAARITGLVLLIATVLGFWLVWFESARDRTSSGGIRLNRGISARKQSGSV